MKKKNNLKKTVKRNTFKKYKNKRNTYKNKRKKTKIVTQKRKRLRRTKKRLKGGADSEDVTASRFEVKITDPEFHSIINLFCFSSSPETDGWGGWLMGKVRDTIIASGLILGGILRGSISQTLQPIIDFFTVDDETIKFNGWILMRFDPDRVTRELPHYISFKFDDSSISKLARQVLELNYPIDEIVTSLTIPEHIKAIIKGGYERLMYETTITLIYIADTLLVRFDASYIPSGAPKTFRIATKQGGRALGTHLRPIQRIIRGVNDFIDTEKELLDIEEEQEKKEIRAKAESAMIIAYQEAKRLEEEEAMVSHVPQPAANLVRDTVVGYSAESGADRPPEWVAERIRDTEDMQQTHGLVEEAGSEEAGSRARSPPRDETRYRAHSPPRDETRYRARSPPRDETRYRSRSPAKVYQAGNRSRSPNPETFSASPPPTVSAPTALHMGSRPDPRYSRGDY